MLTTSQLDFLHDHGYLIMRQLVTGRELELLQQASQRLVDDGVARRGDDHLYMGDQYWRTERLWSKDAAFRAVAVHPALLENVAQAVGKPIYPWNDSLVVKAARTGSAVGWHQDPPYGAHFGRAPRMTHHSIPNFTTDIYLDRSTRDNGCVWAVPGHHLVGTAQLPDDEACFAHPQAVPIEMEPGDVLFHFLATPHGSRANRTPHQRRTFYIHYLCEESYQESYGCHRGEATWEWLASKDGWGDAMRSQILAMQADRSTLGLANDGRARLGDGGFTVPGAVAAAPDALTRRMARLSAAEAASLRSLRDAECGSPAASAAGAV